MIRSTSDFFVKTSHNFNNKNIPPLKIAEFISHKFKTLSLPRCHVQAGERLDAYKAKTNSLFCLVLCVFLRTQKQAASSLYVKLLLSSCSIISEFILPSTVYMLQPFFYPVVVISSK